MMSSPFLRILILPRMKMYHVSFFIDSAAETFMDLLSTIRVSEPFAGRPPPAYLSLKPIDSHSLQNFS